MVPMIALSVTLLGAACLGMEGVDGCSGGAFPRVCRGLFVRDDTFAQEAYRSAWSGIRTGPQGATELFTRALEANPASPYRWCDLGESLLASGNEEIARKCISRAVELGPAIPQILLRAANLDFRIGATPEALRYGARVLALVPDYDRLIFSTYSRFEAGEALVLQYGIPNDRRAGQSYFRYALSSADSNSADNVALLGAIWTWLGSRHFRDRATANEYAAFLSSRGLREQASKIALEIE